MTARVSAQDPITRFCLWLAAGLLLASLATRVAADALEDAMTAYREQDYDKAVELFRPLAENGNANAQYMLGTCYIEGKGVKPDDKTAVMWFQRAANQGDARAQYNLGASYAEGTGVDKSDEQAARWFTRAANQGMVYAEFNLALLYAAGNGVKQDNIEAFKWLEIAFRSLDAGGPRSDVARAMTDVAAKMTRDELDEARVRARRWKAQPEMAMGRTGATAPQAH
ncbi:MAG TPA: tetratricopeptide repeat protein [Casimicrobiaceae bacterium]|nr:tetratricopeptide repeat protein [Casimicrobiaceae bacterium]